MSSGAVICGWTACISRPLLRRNGHSDTLNRLFAHARTTAGSTTSPLASCTTSTSRLLPPAKRCRRQDLGGTQVIAGPLVEEIEHTGSCQGLALWGHPNTKGSRSETRSNSYRSELKESKHSAIAKGWKGRDRHDRGFRGSVAPCTLGMRAYIAASFPIDVIVSQRSRPCLSETPSRCGPRPAPT